MINQYAPGRAESGGFRNPFFSSEIAGSLLCGEQLKAKNTVAAIVIAIIVLFMQFFFISGVFSNVIYASVFSIINFSAFPNVYKPLAASINATILSHGIDGSNIWAGAKRKPPFSPKSPFVS
jgi:hypothetical protein